METVGKTYMAASGLQGSRRNHAVSLVALGLDMVRAISFVKTKDGTKCALTVRVGIASGMVVSGVCGLKKQQFSLFGDTVNTASRMQSNARENEVRITTQTYAACASEVQAVLDKANVKVRDGYCVAVLSASLAARYQPVRLSLAVHVVQHRVF